MTIVTDDFNRANEATLGGNWTTGGLNGPATGLKLSANAVIRQGVNPNFTRDGSYFNAYTAPANIPVSLLVKINQVGVGDGEVIVIDVRPATEYAAAHLPFARSIPLAELKKRLTELPKDKNIVAYCRGPFCLFATEAVRIIEHAGLHAKRLDDGVAEWQANGFSIEK